MTSIWPFSQATSTPSLARIIPARGMTLVERSALEGTMQSLVLQGSALALGIASTLPLHSRHEACNFCYAHHLKTLYVPRHGRSRYAIPRSSYATFPLKKTHYTYKNMRQ
ncbi:hypothetical protein KSB_47900 [Ktedonobacter robiniae]|uniref:Uncharacterized protein n=1 Tax=Ktedonobacter robiniae TaxID=2778365 RepID=A0ABQ3UV79_9CHLR|nr:hypothetical protein KSB_47900 [Ktedonobacter robiniae]